MKKRKRQLDVPYFGEDGGTEEEHVSYLLTILLKEVSPTIDVVDTYPLILDLLLHGFNEEDIIKTAALIRATSKPGASRATH